MISKWMRDTVSSLSTRSFSAALPTRNTSPAIRNSVPRCAPLITTSLQRRRLTVAGVASRRMRVPVRCSIVTWYRDHTRASRSGADPARGRVAPVRSAPRSLTFTCVAPRGTRAASARHRMRRGSPARFLSGGSNESTFQRVQRLFGGPVLAASLSICGAIASAAVAHAQPAPARPSDAPLPSCLDQTIKDQLGADLKPRGVQKRDFIKNKKIVVVGHGGLYGGDLTSSSWIAGGSLGFFFTEDLGVAVEFDATPLTVDLDAPLNKFFGDSRFAPGMSYLGLANLLWSPIHAKLKLGGGIVHADVMVFAGGGRMFHDAVQGLSFDAGSAIDLFVTRALTIRIDLRDLMAIEEISGETRYTNNLIATAGLALYLPSGL